MTGLCLAARDGRQEDLPGRKVRRTRRAREVVLLIAQSGGAGSKSVLVERRPSPGLWGGLWSPPQFEDELAALDWCRREVGAPERAAEQPPPIDHAFTHFDLRLLPMVVHCEPVSRVEDSSASRLWYSLQTPPRVGLPQPILSLFTRLQGLPST